MTQHIDTKINELENHVNQYTADVSTPIVLDEKVYLYIIIASLFVLIIFRPSFLYIEPKPLDKDKEPRFCWKRLLIMWLCLSVIFSVVYFSYRYKQKND